MRAWVALLAVILVEPAQAQTTSLRCEIATKFSCAPNVACRLLGQLALLIATTFGLAEIRPAQAQTMTFFAQPPKQPIEIFGNAWSIYADGPIDPGAPERLQKLIAANQLPPMSVLYLNSPGGNLFAGMKLGQLLRKNGFFTQVMKRGPSESAGGSRGPIPGVCLSACTLTYIGGVFRWLDPKAIYGVHRFFGSNSFDADAAQVTSAAVVQYIRDMGVDPDLFAEMTKAGRDEINVLARGRLESLGVVNNGAERTRWSIESTGTAMYLKGERNTQYGINKFLLVCTQGDLSLYVIFDPIGRGEEVKGLGAQSLMIDGQPIPIAQLKMRRTEIVNGWINAEYSLTPNLIQRIRAAKTVGIAFQPVYGSPVFMGFDNMELADGRQKMAGLIETCRK